MRTVLSVLASVTLLAAPAAALPRGTALFFQDACPDGWRSLDEATGRLVVSVATTQIEGLTLGTALSDQEDRTHSHSGTATAELPSHSVSGAGGSNTEGAHSGPAAGSSSFQAASSGLSFVQFPLCALSEDDTSSMPINSVAFFAPFSYDPTNPAYNTTFFPLPALAGRVLVPDSDMGLTLSADHPLASLEDRPHSHVNAGIDCAITLSSCSFVGIGGCCNGDPTSDGAQTVDQVTAANASSNLPYIQLMTASVLTPSYTVNLPETATFFTLDQVMGCPPGWRIWEGAGTFLVALPENGEIGARFGGEPFVSPNQRINHTHPITGTVSTPSAGIELASGCCAGGYGCSGDYDFSCTSNALSGVGIPFAALPLCVHT